MEECRHESCHCRTSEMQDFCSLYCKNAQAGDDAGHACSCGHPDCRD